nr:30S ribosomal protein S9 [Gammaproteobacteria bacterium]
MAQYFEGIGRRKASTARVRVTPGRGEFIVNEKPM